MGPRGYRRRKVGVERSGSTTTNSESIRVVVAHKAQPESEPSQPVESIAGDDLTRSRSEPIRVDAGGSLGSDEMLGLEGTIGLATTGDDPGGGGSGWSSVLAVRTGRLRRSLAVHFRPIDLVVFQEPSYPLGNGNLVLKRASRLDAFSAYPGPT